MKRVALWVDPATHRKLREVAMSEQVFRHVLVGWDGSAGAAAGLRLGLRLTAVGEGRLVALNVVPSYAHLEDADSRRRAEDEVRAQADEPYQAVLERHPLHPGQSVELKFVEAHDVVGVLDEYAATHLLDLVIVGLHGRDSMLHPRMGHIASHAVRSMRCPVLVVPDHDSVAAPRPATASKVSGLFHPFHRHGKGGATATRRQALRTSGAAGHPWPADVSDSADSI
jgi:nucleotide-binding universal stress UspA family protein